MFSADINLFVVNLDNRDHWIATQGLQGFELIKEQIATDDKIAMVFIRKQDDGEFVLRPRPTRQFGKPLISDPDDVYEERSSEYSPNPEHEAMVRFLEESSETNEDK